MSYEETLVGIDAVGRVLFANTYTVGGMMQPDEEAVGRHRARMVTESIRDYCFSRLSAPGGWVETWVLGTSDGDQDITELVRRGYGSLDFVRFCHAPAPPERRKPWYRRKIRIRIEWSV